MHIWKKKEPCLEKQDSFYGFLALCKFSYQIKQPHCGVWPFVPTLPLHIWTDKGILWYAHRIQPILKQRDSLFIDYTAGYIHTGIHNIDHGLSSVNNGIDQNNPELFTLTLEQAQAPQKYWENEKSSFHQIDEARKV